MRSFQKWWLSLFKQTNKPTPTKYSVALSLVIQPGVIMKLLKSWVTVKDTVIQEEIKTANFQWEDILQGIVGKQTGPAFQIQVSDCSHSWSK